MMVPKSPPILTHHVHGLHVDAFGVSFLVAEGMIRRLCVDDTEIVRAISAPIRDENWGTVPVISQPLVHEISADKLSLFHAFTCANGVLSGQLIFILEATGVLTTRLEISAGEDFSTNRTGLSLLHPLDLVAGADLKVGHPDGTETNTCFPQFISPGQTAFNIVHLSHQIGLVSVDIGFEGEVFEMEDQRNWSDASFKTYCRPLARPVPYVIRAGERLSQEIVVKFQKNTGRTVEPQTVTEPLQATIRLPEVRLALQPEWLKSDMPAGYHATIRFGRPDAWSDAALKQVIASCETLDIEIVVDDDRNALKVLQAVRTRVLKEGGVVAHVTALPAAYLRSYQPQGLWPTGTDPETITALAAGVFEDSRIGVGMLTHFTEFNRYRPATDGDFVTFGNSAIVHAADDLSVMETLEAMPHIFASAHNIADGKSIRLGLMSIAMRTNPYGASLSPRLDENPIAMTDDDPRQSRPFAAAYAVVVAALAGRAGVKSICLAAPYGPLGAWNDDGSARPILHAINALVDLSGCDAVLLRKTDGLVTIEAGFKTIMANVGDLSLSVLVPNQTFAVLDTNSTVAAGDPDWLKSEKQDAKGSIVLESGAVLFAGFGEDNA